MEYHNSVLQCESSYKLVQKDLPGTYPYRSQFDCAHTLHMESRICQRQAMIASSATVLSERPVSHR